MSEELDLIDYLKFANNIRFTTSKALLNVIENSSSIKLFGKPGYISDIEMKNILKLKIVDEYIASTEDFLMWFMALKNRKELFIKSKIDLEFETFLLQNGVTKTSREENKRIIENIPKINTRDDLVNFLNMPSIGELAIVTKQKHEYFEKLLDRIIKELKIIYEVRFTLGNVYLTLHNRMKHGLVISKNGEFKKIEFKINGFLKTKIIKFDLDIDNDSIKKYVNTIYFISFSILAIGGILSYLYLYYVRLRRLRKIG